MSKLEKIVPSMELCKKIPEGEFRDTTLVWETYSSKYSIEPVVIDRETSESTPHEFVKNVYPAPTLNEIMDMLKDITERPNIYYGKLTKTWVCDSMEYLAPIRDKNSVSAAIRMWFKVKGVEE